MKKTAVIAVFIVAGLLLSGLALAEEKLTDKWVSRHMVAQAMLTAHFIDAALKAGMSTEEINAVLARVADETVISEFWITDEAGRIAYTNLPGTAFVFPTDPQAGTQAAPFATLLSGDETVVVQGSCRVSWTPRRSSTSAWPGSTRPRIVQVGVAGADME